MSTRRVALVTLGCVRNDVDSEELAGRLAGAGWDLVADPAQADVAVVNTCGFIEAAKQDSIDVLLDVASLRAEPTARTQAVVAVGCLAQRYGSELADALPEADAVLGFDSYPDLSEHLDGILHGHVPAPPVPRDRRTLLPLAPAERQTARAASGAARAPVGDGAPVGAGGPASGPRVVRARLDAAPWAPLKLASGCDRRCTFCAIPSFRGAFVSRPPADVLAEAAWLAERGVRELLLVSENTTSYGKDLGDLRSLEKLLPQLTALTGVERVRLSYLQPAEVRPGLLEAIAGTPGVAPYADLSFQHAAPGVLRRMRRFGGTEAFWDLLGRLRDLAPDAGVRTNVIVGFPGESEADLAELERFLAGARLDVVGVFGYSDEDGTAAADLDGKLPQHEIDARVERVSALVDELVAQRAAERVGELAEVLVEEVRDGEVWGRTAMQGPEVDGATRLRLSDIDGGDDHDGGDRPAIGALVPVRVVGSDGVDLHAQVLGAWR